MNDVFVKSSLLDPYGQFVRNFIVQEFPKVTMKSQYQLLDSITEAIISTGAVRLGPRPSPESLVKIREIISHYTAKQQPIPFVIPWGSEKPDGSSVDIAELGALKTLICLEDRVSSLFAPSIQINIRIEDASAPHLFHDRQEQARIEAARYTTDFVNLIKVLSLDNFIKAKPESTMTTEAIFNETADKWVPVILEHLKTRTLCRDAQKEEETLNAMHRLGWLGSIEDETIEYYLELYEKLYPEKALGEKIHILSRYFAGAAARRTLKIRGDEPAWEGQYIDLAFAVSPPGTEGYFNKRVTYRTFPSHLTSNHIVPTRAKGYLHILNDGTIKPKLASFHDALHYNTHTVTLSKGDLSVNIKADYIIDDGIISEPTKRILTGVL